MPLVGVRGPTEMPSVATSCLFPPSSQLMVIVIAAVVASIVLVVVVMVVVVMTEVLYRVRRARRVSMRMLMPTRCEILSDTQLN